MTMERHELNIWPNASPQVRVELEESLKTYGQKEPMTRHEGKILDGMQRYPLIMKLGLDPWFEDFKENGISASDFVLIKNQRRNITEDQKTICALQFYDLIKYPKRSQVKFEGKKGQDHSKILCCKKFGIKQKNLSYAVTIQKRNPDLLQKVKSGEMRIYKAFKIVSKITPTNSVKRQHENALSLLHRKLKEGWTVEMKMKEGSFQCHVSGDGVAPIRFQSEWSEKVVFEKFYEALFSECNKH